MKYNNCIMMMTAYIHAIVVAFSRRSCQTITKFERQLDNKIVVFLCFFFCLLNYIYMLQFLYTLIQWK